jgi:serine/threonine-protein kinase HipA
MTTAPRALLRERASRRSHVVAAAAGSIARHVSAVWKDWLVAGTDAHAKNYSILIGAEGRVRLAPLYDRASALPFAEKQLRKLKLAMSIGGRYRVHEIDLHRWEKFAGELKLDGEQVRERVLAMTEALTDLTATVLSRRRREGLTHPILGCSERS